MYWLYLLLAIGALVLSMRTSSMALMAVGLLASLGLLVAWIMGRYGSRVGERRREQTPMIDPVELHRLRELARTRKQDTAPPP